jgi:hypothetical protein
MHLAHNQQGAYVMVSPTDIIGSQLGWGQEDVIMVCEEPYMCLCKFDCFVRFHGHDSLVCAAYMRMNMWVKICIEE